MDFTTKRHPRSLAEAFPHTAEYGCAVTVYRTSWFTRLCRLFRWL